MKFSEFVFERWWFSLTYNAIISDLKTNKFKHKYHTDKTMKNQTYNKLPKESIMPGVIKNLKPKNF